MSQYYSKIFTIGVFALASSLCQAGELIKSIAVKGNYRAEEAMIINSLSVKIGSSYGADTEDSIAQQLYTTGLFEDIRLTNNRGNLIIEVQEKPLIVKLSLTGNSHLKPDKLMPELMTKTGSSLSEANLRHDIVKIREIYKKQGRFLIQVEPKIKHLPNRRVEVTLEIAEGPRALIRNIYFTGNNKYRDAELESIILTKRSAWYRFMNPYNVYDPDRMEYDKELLRQFYSSVGYVDFRVISATSELAKTKDHFTLHYVIDEGAQYTLGKISVNNKLENIDVSKLEKMISSKTGDLYNLRSLENISLRMSNWLADQGYPQIAVQINKVKKNQDRIVDIEFTTTQSPKYFINKINISGNYKTQDEVIRQHLKVTEGDPYNRTLIELSEKKLRDLAYFSALKVNYAATKREDNIDLQVDVQEARTGKLGLNGGYNGTLGAFCQLFYSDRNLLGTGQSISFGPRWAASGNNFVASFVNPSFLNRDMTAGATLNWIGIGAAKKLKDKKDQTNPANTDDPNIDSDINAAADPMRLYTNNTPSLRLFLEYGLTDHLTQDVYYLVKSMVPSGEQASKMNFKEYVAALGKDLTSAVGTTFIYDQTDSRILTKRGYLLSTTQEYAGLGGKTHYFKLSGEGKFFKSFVNNQYTARLSVSGGIIHNFDKKLLLANDRFYLGDSDMRGFAYTGLGPRNESTGSSVGGQKYYTVTGELQFPLGLPKEIDIKGVAFCDIGSVWGLELDDAVKNKVVYNDATPRVAIGLGISWVNGLCPLRLDYAIPLKHEKLDVLQNFHFRVATQF